MRFGCTKDPSRVVPRSQSGLIHILPLPPQFFCSPPLSIIFDQPDLIALETMPSDAEPGKLEDVPRLVEIWEACFNSEILHALFPPNEIGRTYLTRAWNWYMEENSPPKVFVIRDDDGAYDHREAICVCLTN